MLTHARKTVGAIFIRTLYLQNRLAVVNLRNIPITILGMITLITYFKRASGYHLPPGTDLETMAQRLLALSALLLTPLGLLARVFPVGFEVWQSYPRRVSGCIFLDG